MPLSISNLLCIPTKKKSRCRVQIHLESPKPFYTPGDVVKGTASILVPRDTELDHVEIILEGKVRTMVPQSSQNNRIPFTLEHIFLQLKQPIDKTTDTPTHVSPSVDLHDIPFLFTVPDRLILGECTQIRNDTHAGNSHTTLLPSLGDPDISFGKALPCDMMSKYGQVTYKIHASALTFTSSAERKAMSLTASIPLCVIPAAYEGSGTLAGASSHIVHNSTHIKRGKLHGTAGKLWISSEKPKPLRPPMRGSSTDEYGSTSVTINVGFCPATQSDLPPCLDTLKLKLLSCTSLAVPASRLHSGLSNACFSHDQRCFYNDTTNLPTMDVKTAQWTKRVSEDEYDSDDSVHGATHGIFFTAQLIVPVVLPKTKLFVSDFQSCVISRSYSLDLSLSYHKAGISLATSRLSLQVPVSIHECVKRNALARVETDRHEFEKPIINTDL